MKHGLARAAAALTVGLLAFLPLSAGAATRSLVDLPLSKGYYVLASRPCSRASMASVILYTGHGFTTACHIKRIERTGDHKYKVTQNCDAIGMNTPAGTNTRVYTIADKDDFQANSGPKMHFCPQPTLPEPWRSNDLEPFLK